MIVWDNLATEYGSFADDWLHAGTNHLGRRPGPMTTQIIVLNGGSSSGKTGIARCLQAILPQPWIGISVDDLIDALPPSLMEAGSGVTFGQQGEVTVGEGFREIEAAWLTGVAAMARAGARIVIDDVFLGGATSQERVRTHLEGLAILWLAWDRLVKAIRQIAALDPKSRSEKGAGW